MKTKQTLSRTHDSFYGNPYRHLNIIDDGVLDKNGMSCFRKKEEGKLLHGCTGLYCRRREVVRLD